MNAKDTLLGFAHSHSIDGFCEGDTVKDMINTNYQLLTPEIMKQLVATAIQERDIKIAAGGSENDLLGSWGVIIDAYKEVTVEKRDRAGGILQQLCAIGMQGGPEAIKVFVQDLREKSLIDSVLADLIASTYAERSQYRGNDTIIRVVEHIFAAMQPEIGSPTGSVLSSSSSSSVSQSAGKVGRDELDMRLMEAAGELLRDLMKRSAGDANKLRSEAIERMRRPPPSQPAGLESASFQKVLNDNIDACKAAGYVNKARIFEFLREVIASESSQPGTGTMSEEAASKVASSLSMHHAPQFVDERKDLIGTLSEIKVSLVDETSGYIDAINVSDALRFAATGNNSDTASKYSKANSKKKSVKSAVKKKVGNMAEEVGRHLEEFGWAVCDHTIPEDLVRRVRIESGLFTDHFEQAEIWVGKQADIGAQLVVPSVRGDRVLWMCGGHNSTAPEGVSRTVRTIGEIEPCRLEVKAQAPIKSFKAMKELVAIIDKLVFSMKDKCPSLAGIYERSDAMLSIYPGEGARFAKHIDNTTRDGRRLTVLVYLNPGWSVEQGGALRLFTANAMTAKREHSQDTRHDSNEGVAENDAESLEYEGGRKIHCKNGVEPDRMTAVDVFPEGGRLAMFYSADVPHEVLPTFGMRHAITIWYYDTDERQAAVKAAVDKGVVDAATHANIEAQRAAKNFIAELMGGDEVSADGGEPTQEELQLLCGRVTALSDEVLGLVASITGAPSVQSFREGFPLLVTDDLKQMRALFRRMGLASYDLG